MAQSLEILLVEDSPADANLTMEALRDPQVPNRIHVVGDGVEALRFLRRHAPHAAAPRPDIILLDLNLPRMDGKEVLAEIKSDANLKDIPVIVLTCSGNPQDVEHVYRNQAAGYITKHPELDRYFTAIRSLKELWFNFMTLPKKAAQQNTA
jgi:two-component system, chemotaxis family, response regulator Rcp1